MDPYVLLWFLVLLGTLAAEAATVSLVSLWFAGGALAALIAALCRAGFVVQFVLHGGVRRAPRRALAAAAEAPQKAPPPGEP